MKKLTFKGGTHPPERKDRSRESPIERLDPAKRVAIPLNQHLGQPIRHLVKVGDIVRRGQKIGDGDDRMAAPVHASIAGTVTKIESWPLANNAEGTCIVIESGEESGEDAFLPPLDAFSCSRDEALSRIREAGIVGMGGAGFPTHVKLSPDRPISLAIANAAECEPYLSADERLLAERPDDIVEGLAIVMRIVGAPSGVIGIEANKAYVVPGVEKAIAARGRGYDIKAALLKTKYPQGGEKMLITALCGKEVPSRGLPQDVGCVVQNIATLIAVAEAFREGKPVIERAFTLTGGACLAPRNLIAPIGTLISDIVGSGAVEVDDEELGRVVIGGPMMGVSVPSYSLPLQKNTSGVVFMSRKEAAFYAEGPCIRCGRCMRACSCRLSPAMIASALSAGDLEEADAIGLGDCVECGTCSYVCPARIQLVQRFRVGKALLRARNRKEAQIAR
jgi:Na+-translocating ferredoxin:NAD+ oxidoreductase subunit C